MTPYSTEIIGHLFGDSKAYYRGREFKNTDPRYEKSMRYANADKDGHYKMFNVPSGDFYLYAVVSDPPSGAYFSTYERVQVVDGKPMRVDLDGV